jgi:hypothetical protein
MQLPWTGEIHTKFLPEDLKERDNLDMRWHDNIKMGLKKNRIWW